MSHIRVATFTPTHNCRRKLCSLSLVFESAMITLRSLTETTQMTTSNVLLLLNPVECVSRTHAPSTQRLAGETEMSVAIVIFNLFYCRWNRRSKEVNETVHLRFVARRNTTVRRSPLLESLPSQLHPINIRIVNVCFALGASHIRFFCVYFVVIHLS
jgi:hypothetical protein